MGRRFNIPTRDWKGFIVRLEPSEIFCFGSNLAGIHGAGAAAQAHKCFGAQWGIGEGRTGQCYAIPTKDSGIVTLSLPRIETYVNRFLEHARQNPDTQFLLTPVGCGLAGFEPKNIAPMFKDAPENVIKPEEFL